MKSAGPSVGGLGERREGEGVGEHRGISSAHFVAVVDSIPRVVAIEQSRAGELSSKGGSKGGTLSVSLSLPLVLPPSTTDSKIVVRCFCFERASTTRDRVHASARPYFSFPSLFFLSPSIVNTGEL